MTVTDNAGAADGEGGARSVDPPDTTLANEYTDPARLAGGLAWPIRILTGVAAVFMLTATAFVFVDVTGRYAFNRPIPGGVEIVEFILGLLIFSALPLVTVKNAHVTVELFDNFMSAEFKRWRNAVVLVASAAMLAFITERMWGTATYMLEQDEISLHLEIPTAPILFVVSGLSAISFAAQMYMAWRFVSQEFGGRR